MHLLSDGSVCGVFMWGVFACLDVAVWGHVVGDEVSIVSVFVLIFCEPLGMHKQHFV